jgi:lipoprotein-anchoring transpeptidase ErfK/SrfK
MTKRYAIRSMLLGSLLAAQLVFSVRTTHAAGCLSAVDAPGCAYGLPAEQYQALLPIMLANTEPSARPLDVDTVTVKQYSSKTGAASSFTGVLLDGGLPYPMAWVITSSRPSALPGKTAETRAPIVPRYARVYLFSTLKVNGWKWYLVGPGQWLRQTSLARVVPAKRPDGVQGRWIAVDVWQQVLTAYESDRLIFTTLISSGKPSHPTRQGVHHIWARFLTDDMNGSMGSPDAYSLPYVPFVMYFDRSISLHGAYWHNNFGYAQSHGCVNMSLTDAHWLFNWTETAPDAAVYVWSSR